MAEEVELEFDVPSLAKGESRPLYPAHGPCVEAGLQFVVPRRPRASRRSLPPLFRRGSASPRASRRRDEPASPRRPPPRGSERRVAARRWNLKGNPIDLDAQAVVIDRAGKVADATYYNQKDALGGAVKLSGDSRDGEGSGDDECVTVNISRFCRRASGASRSSLRRTRAGTSRTSSARAWSCVRRARMACKRSSMTSSSAFTARRRRASPPCSRATRTQTSGSSTPQTRRSGWRATSATLCRRSCRS